MNTEQTNGAVNDTAGKVQLKARKSAEHKEQPARGPQKEVVVRVKKMRGGGARGLLMEAASKP